MKKEIYLRFDNGMPKSTAQEKGECIRYKILNGKRMAYIHHYKKGSVAALRKEYELRLRPHRPAEPFEGPVKLLVVFFYDIKGPKKLWGKYKTKKPDGSNAIKELEDAMTAVGFWHDDAQVADLRVIKYYAEKAQIYIRVEELEE